MQKQFFSQLENKNLEYVNEDLIYNMRDEDITKYLISAYKGLEILDGLKFIDHLHITEESKFDKDVINRSHNKTQIDKNITKRISLDVTRCSMFRAYFMVKCKVKVQNLVGFNSDGIMLVVFNLGDKKWSFGAVNKYGKIVHDYNVPRNEGHVIKFDDDISIAKDMNNNICYRVVYVLDLFIPKMYKNFYYLLNGNKFYPTYQLVDSSTYNNGNIVTLKSTYSPILLKRENSTLNTVHGEEFNVPKYSIFIFNKMLNPIMYYLPMLGLTNTLRYMDLQNIICVRDNYEEDDDHYIFSTEKDIYIYVIKYFFDEDRFIQSIVKSLELAINDIKSSKFNLKLVDDVKVWCIQLGKLFTTVQISAKQYDKGRGILASFNRLLDDSTRQSLKLKYHNKRDMYAVCRWLWRNFSELNSKDNMDLVNKRIRYGEYISYYFVKYLSVRVNNTLSKRELKLKDIKNLLVIKPDFLIKQLNSSKKKKESVTTPVIKYDESVNDADIHIALNYSLKGPGTMGEKSDNIGDKYRGVHHSYVGRLDLNTSGTSDPGTGGMFVPFVKTYGNYFDPSEEPQGWTDNFYRIYKNYFGAEYTAEPLSIYKEVFGFIDYENVQYYNKKTIKQKNKPTIEISLKKKDKQK